jgi:hypothetical protein
MFLIEFNPPFFLSHAILFTHSHAPPDSKRTLEILTSVSPNFKKSNTFCWRVSCPASSRFTHSISNYVPGRSPGFVHRSRRQGRWPWQIFSFIRSFKAPNQLHIPFLSVYYPSINATCVRQLNKPENVQHVETANSEEFQTGEITVLTQSRGIRKKKRGQWLH